jgi:tetratricopeptide (TPR) repeat protein
LEVRVKSILHPGLRRGLSRRGAVALLSIFLIGLVSIASGKLGMRAAEPQQEPSPDVMVGVETSPEPDVLVGTKAQPRPDDVMLVDGKGNPEGERAFKKAYELHKQERFEEAAAAFLEAADVGFRPGTARYNAACCYARLGLTADAVHLIEQAFEEDFDNYDLLMKDSDLDPIRREPAFQQMMEQMRDQGRLHGDSGDRYQVAMEMYEELGDESSTNGKAWYKVGSALLGFREYDRGIDALDRAVEHLGDGNSGALYNLACAYSLKGEARPALDYLERAVLAGFDSEERFRNDSDLDNIRDNERFADISALHDTLSLDRYRDKKDWSGSDYSAQRWAPAVEELTEFTERNPDVGRGWYGLGLALHYSGRYAEALEAFQKQLDLGYKTSVATYNIACAYAMNNDADAALTWLGRAVDTGDFGSKQIRHDKDLKTLHEDPRFEELIERAAENDKDHEIRFKFEKEFYWQEREKQKQKKQEAASIS